MKHLPKYIKPIHTDISITSKYPKLFITSKSILPCNLGVVLRFFKVAYPYDPPPITVFSLIF